jgi:hypothetical protein
VDALLQLADLARGPAAHAAFDVLVAQPELIDRIAAGEHAIGAAVIRAAARCPDATATPVVDLVTRLAARIGVPRRLSGLEDTAYIEALVGWHEAILGSAHVARSWDALERLLGVDFGAHVTARGKFLGVLAEIGLGSAVPPGVEGALLDAAEQAHLYHLDDRQFLSVLAFRLACALRDGGRAALAGPWLLAWCRCFADAPLTRGRRKLGMRSLMVLKDEVHGRLARACGIVDLLTGRCGGARGAAILLLVKLDHVLFGATGASTWRQSRPWHGLLCAAFRRLAAAAPPRRTAAAGTRPGGLRVLAPDAAMPQPGDVLITRARGGLGDVMTMRPGVLELARRGAGRVIFATDPGLFPAFSVDDDLCLVDIHRLPCPPARFEAWINLTNCPAVRVEASEVPAVRSNRIKIFADALGVPDLDIGRLAPLRFEPALDEAAAARLRHLAAPGIRTLGIQLRSAETYKDVPILLEAARALARRHCVLVFDSRPIPRDAGDRFIAIDDQPLSAALALASKLDVLVAPDSSMLHLAGFNRIRGLGVFGPTDGLVRCAPYPTVQPFDLRAAFACMPCWRNQDLACRMTEGPESLCMQRIAVADIVERVEALLRAP